jgi:hypothetical protein
MTNKSPLQESAPYQMSVEITESEENEIIEQFRTREPSKKKTGEASNPYPKEIIVRFRSSRDANHFCQLVHSYIDYSDKNFTFKAPEKEKIGQIDKSYCFTGEAPVRRESNRNQEWRKLWTDMPSFKQENNDWIFHSIKVICETRDDYAALAHTLRQFLKPSTSAIYHPSWKPANLKQWVWESSLPEAERSPKYPVYIISRGRAYSRYTAKALEELGVFYYMVVEPKEYETYDSVIDSDKGEVLALPFDSDPANPTGPGRARNWCWDHAKANGHKRHWVMDDNIQAFHRLEKNRRIEVGDGAMFRAMEDFVDRFENVMVAGPNYRFFTAPKQELPPFVLNTRIYSCLLIHNNCPHRWRERYNEDTILALDVLTDEDENGERRFCTIQFNAFLQDKIVTQRLKGGNTEVFYHAEGDDFNEKNYNATGTVRKSLTLEKAYPEYASVEVRYDRVHHYVNYLPFKSNKLVVNPNYKAPADPEYGMKLVNRYKN